MTIRAELDGQIVTIPARRARLATSPFEIAIAVSAVINGALTLLLPHAVEGGNLHALVPLWMAYAVNLGYAAAGGMLLGGLWTDRRKVEICGAVALALFLSVDLVVLIGVRGVAALRSISTFIALIGACVARVLILWSYQHLIAIRSRRRTAQEHISGG